jgi:NADH:ubiquinone oxidoreductase subunit D
VSNYEIYDLIDAYIPIGFQGDCYDRYLIRLEEMRSSLYIINECLVLLQFLRGSFILEDFKIVPPYRSL